MNALKIPLSTRLESCLILPHTDVFHVPLVRLVAALDKLSVEKLYFREKVYEQVLPSFKLESGAKICILDALHFALTLDGEPRERLLSLLLLEPFIYMKGDDL